MRDTSIYVFDLKEIYKAPLAYQNKKSVIVNSGYMIGSPRFEKGVDYIFFGRVWHNKQSGETEILAEACSKTNIDPEFFPSYYKQKAEIKSDTILAYHSGAIFIGEVLSAHHDMKVKKFFSGTKEVKILKSLITFDITNVIQNQEYQGFSFKEGEKVGVHFQACGQGYRLGEKYIIFASLGGKRTLHPGGGTSFERYVTAQCFSSTPYDINLKTKLRELRQILLR